MKIIVCVKQVPDTSGKVAVNPDGTLNRASMATITNPDDLNAVEAALVLKEQTGAEVVVVCMGPPPAEGMLRECLARGCDRAVLVSGREFGGSDTYATSQILAAAINKIGVDAEDIVMCGRQAIDGDTAQVGPQIAEKLGIPQLCYVEEVRELTEKRITVRRAIEGGYEVLACPLPALLTVIDANDPRPENVKKMMRYKRARTPLEVAAKYAKDGSQADAMQQELDDLKAKELLITEFSAADLEADPNRIGFPGSPTKVKQVQSVILTAGSAKSVEPTAEAIAELIHELISDHTLG